MIASQSNITMSQGQSVIIINTPDYPTPVANTSSLAVRNQSDANVTPSVIYSNPKIESFQISYLQTGSLSLNPGIFITGGKLEAVVQLVLKLPIKALRMELTVVGIAKLGNMKRKIFKERHILYGSSDSRTHSTIQRGDHSFPVAINLPTTLLPSAECKANFVKYYCKVAIVRFLGKNNICIQRAFEVYQNNPNTANQLVERQTPLDYDARCGSQIMMAYQLNKTGFSLGENLVISGEIMNDKRSSVPVKIGMDLVQKVKIHGAINIGVAKIPAKSQCEQVVSSQWSQTINVPGKQAESFSMELNLVATAPTANTIDVEILHLVRVKVLKESFSVIKRKPKMFDHDLFIALPAQLYGLHKSASRISLGKSSLRKVPRVRQPIGTSPAQRDSSIPNISTTQQIQPLHEKGSLICSDTSPSAEVAYPNAPLPPNRQASAPSPNRSASLTPVADATPGWSYTSGSPRAGTRRSLAFIPNARNKKSPEQPPWESPPPAYGDALNYKFQ